jgi:hypothetical protein
VTLLIIISFTTRFVFVVNSCYFVIFLGSEKPEVPSSPIPDEHSNSPLGTISIILLFNVSPIQL